VTNSYGTWSHAILSTNKLTIIKVIQYTYL